ncbi:reverse transcriptase domain-containing protein [Agrobacterium leguminum]
MDAAAKCTDLETLSGFLGFAPQHIFYLVENPSRFYVRISVPKKSDPTKNRQLDIPSTELKGVQRAINKKILRNVSLSPSVYSYVSGKSIITAAQNFCPGRAVLKLDIHDFFPSISFARVYGIFKSLGFNESSSFILTRLTTKDNCLAQGAPTSPALSNVLMRSVDVRLSQLAQSWELKYLRYSDDIFFHKERNFNHTRLAEIAYDIIERSGFEANRDKTKFHAKGLPRLTLGLLTHGDLPQIPGPQRRRYRALFFKASRNIHWAEKNKEHLRGVLEWYKCVNGKDDQYVQYRSILDNVSRLRLHDVYQSK